MAVESTMLPLGTQAPDFALSDTVSGETVRRQDFAGQPLLVMFICTHCPYVKHIESELSALGRDYQDKGVAIVAIGANDPENYPDDAPDKLRAQAQAQGFTFPYLFDKTQEVAKAYTAACTPDFFLFDSNHSLVYRGRLDDSRPKSDTPVTGKELRSALEAVLNGQQVASEQYPSMGCNIKWRSGNEPAYFG